MSAVTIEPRFLHHYHHRHRTSNITSIKQVPKLHLICKNPPTPFHVLNYNCTRTATSKYRRCFNHPKAAPSAVEVETSLEPSSEVTFSGTFLLKRPNKVEGKITIKLESGQNEECQLVVGCTLPGKLVLHWGVHYIGDVGSEWDQPPLDMRPPGSIPIKDYAIETPFEEGEASDEVKIDINAKSSIASISFVLKDEESGNWYQNGERDFTVPLIEYLQDDGNVVGGAEAGSGISPGALEEISKEDDLEGLNSQTRPIQGFYEEHSVSKETSFDNSVSVTVRHNPEKAKNELEIETDLPGEVVIHWGVYKDNQEKSWEVPAGPYPPETSLFKNKALRTRLQLKDDGSGSSGSFTIDEGFSGFLYVLKVNETWLNCNGNDFYVPFPSSEVTDNAESTSDSNEVAPEYTDGIIKDLRNLLSSISSEKIRKTKSREAQETILQEIEKLAAEAYGIFRGSTPTFVDTYLSDDEGPDPPVKVSSGTGSGYEILCQGFNWESHKSGNWYMELDEKASKLAELGFTVIWLPPPTDSVSAEGYMPRDLYNLNSRYGDIDQLKKLVKKLHKVGIRALGDAVLNHRCAEFQNENGVWNKFGGRLNWDDRAIVADDPHFQGRGNKSSGECFHAAPNIDHSQEFVRKDITEWLLWLRKEIGYDGWRLDFVRGFWGGYVKDYLEATQPYFTVGEFWDSLQYTYGEMDHNQDAHRQRIVDWINATKTAGAFDVTTKGILHATLERCEYWRLSDQQGKPPGVMGWWPSRAVTFIENHDTGSTQGHWRFPGGKEMQGYAYILTHPGTPSVFYDHIFSDYQSEIAKLIATRKRNKIHCRSTMKIVKAERDVYAAIIDDKLAMKIGPGHYEPSNGNWSVAIEGRDYKVWELSS